MSCNARKYFYARVSSRDQNLARQLAEARRLGIPTERVFCDKASGKNFNRPAYQEMKEHLRAGDEVVVLDLDRLGRNLDQTKEELAWFKAHGILVRVVSMPTTMMELPKGQEWVFEMVNNILIEVLGTIAEQEREKIRSRQREGIEAMPVVDGQRVSSKTGRGFGRPCKIPENFTEVYARQQNGELTLKDAMDLVGVGRTRWYELAKEVGA